MTEAGLNQDTLAAATRICQLADEKNAENIVVINVEGLCSYADALVVCHGRSARQAQTIADFVKSGMKQEGHRVLGIEGDQEGHWVLVDLDDVVVHVFYEPVREFYDIEGIWPDAEIIRPIR